MAVETVAGGGRADPGRDGERDEREAGREGAVAERELQVERAEEKQPEHETGVDQAQKEAAADCTIAELLDAQERLPRAELADGEGDETNEADAADAERLRGDPAGLVGLA